MTEPYCGIGDVPKGHKRGTMRECAEKKQIRYYGIKKIDSKTLDLSKKKNVIPETREKLFAERAFLVGIIGRNKGRYETTKDPKVADEYYKEWKKHEAKLKKVIAKLKIIEAERLKLKQKSKLKRASKGKSKSKLKRASKGKSKSKLKRASKSKSKSKLKRASKSKSKSKGYKKQKK